MSTPLLGVSPLRQAAAWRKRKSSARHRSQRCLCSSLVRLSVSVSPWQRQQGSWQSYLVLPLAELAEHYMQELAYTVFCTYCSIHASPSLRLRVRQTLEV